MESCKEEGGYIFMVAEIIILILALIFFIISIFLFLGKGKWLIAGYNTMPKEDREKYDERKLCKAAAILCMECCILLCVMAYLGYRVDTGLMDQTVLLWFGLAFLIAVIVTIIVVSIYINKKAKK